MDDGNPKLEAQNLVDVIKILIQKMAHAENSKVYYVIIKAF